MEIFTFFRVVLIDVNECVVLKSLFKIALVIVSPTQPANVANGSTSTEMYVCQSEI